MKSFRTTALNLPSLRLEGSLFLPDILEKAALGQGRLQTEADYGLPKGLKLRDEASRAFQIASAQWRTFAALLDRADFNPQRASTQFISELLRDAFAYPAVAAVSGVPVGDRTYPITHLAHATPAAQSAGAKPVAIVIAPHNQGLDDPDPRFAVQGSGAKRKSPFQLAQEFLNASPGQEWALVSNGRTLRLLRDAATLTRPSYLEVDLQDLLAGQRFVEFGSAWRLLHASRAGLLDVATDEPAKTAPPVVWASWQQAGQEEGTRVREGLRRGVTDALITLGQGFVQHPGNEALRQKLQAGDLKREDYFAQLLRLVYRFIFPVHGGRARPGAHRRLSLATTTPPPRPAAPRPSCTPTATPWPACATWPAPPCPYPLRRPVAGRAHRLPRPRHRPATAGPARPGRPVCRQPVRRPGQRGADQRRPAEHDEEPALGRAPGGALAPIDYRNMGTEELGSVYESLLELVPEVDVHARQFGFVGLTSVGSTAGNERKTSGSYYTPDSLVQELIRSALDPVIEDRVAKNPAQPVEALLALRVVDPACGSGHFLLAAARRLAERVAALRSADGAVTPQAYRHALREVVARCIFGVDRNPMAIELARTALWIEGFEEGRPLSFLDHHLQCGDALLGLTDLKALEHGIAKDAFKPLSGDVQGRLPRPGQGQRSGAQAARQGPEGPAAGLALQPTAGGAGGPARHRGHARRFGRRGRRQGGGVSPSAGRRGQQPVGAGGRPGRGRLPAAQDAWHAATGADHRNAARSADGCVRRVHEQRQRPRPGLPGGPRGMPRRKRLPLAVGVSAGVCQGGFDCVLGNPPWERIKLQEEEFFATRHAAVAEARNKAERAQRIQWLSEGTCSPSIWSPTRRTTRRPRARPRSGSTPSSSQRAAQPRQRASLRMWTVTRRPPPADRNWATSTPTRSSPRRSCRSTPGMAGRVSSCRRASRPTTRPKRTLAISHRRPTWRACSGSGRSEGSFPVPTAATRSAC
jgi:hypothetical protein